MKKITCPALLTAMLLTAHANAEGYIGLGIGKVDPDISSEFDDPTGFELFGGAMLNENIAVELFYTDLGSSKDDFVPVWTVKASTIGAGIAAFAPVNDNFSLSARFGVHSWDAELSEQGSGTLGTDDGTDMYFGIGALLSASENVSIGLRYNHYTFDDIDPNMTSVAVILDL